jgi:hypothetical protein
MARKPGQYRPPVTYDCPHCDFKVKKYKAPLIEHLKVEHGVEL